MNTPKPSDPGVIAISTFAYRLLIIFFPSNFRQDYGPHLIQVFRDCSLEAYYQYGNGRLIALWVYTLFDWFKIVVEEQLNRGTDMTRERFIRLSGWALMLAGFVLIAGFGIGRGETSYSDPLGGFDGFYEYGQLILIPSSLLFYMVGMIGLWMRYRKSSGRLGNFSLAIASIFAGLAFLGAIPLFYLVPDWSSSWWTLTFGSMLVMLIGLSLFGVAAIRSKPMPRWNALPLIIGIWFPVVALIGWITEVFGGDSGGINDYMAMVALLFLFFGSIILGFTLQKDVGLENQKISA